MCSRKLLRENDNVMRLNYRSVTTFCTASVNNVMTFSACKSDRNIFYKQFNFGLAPQTFGLVTSSNSLPEGQPHLFIFVSSCVVNFFCIFRVTFMEAVRPNLLLKHTLLLSSVSFLGKQKCCVYGRETMASFTVIINS